MATSEYFLSRASPSDLPEIVQVQYTSFQAPFERELLMGCSSPSEDLPKLSEMYAEESRTDPADIWIKVVEKSTGRIVAASNWKVYVAPATALQRRRDEAPTWLEGDKAVASKGIFEGMNDVRVRENQGPFLRKLCELMSGDETY